MIHWNIATNERVFLTLIEPYHYQYNLPPLEMNIVHKGNRQQIDQRLTDPTVKQNILTDVAVIDAFHDEINTLNAYTILKAKQFDPRAIYRPKSVPGIGNVTIVFTLAAFCLSR